MKRVKFGTIGTSWITEAFIRGARHCEEFELWAIYSRSEDKAKAFAEKNNAVKYYTDLNEMLSDKEIDAVYIASPNSLHAEQAIKAMNAGKHVICEKPVTSNAVEFKEMMETAKKNGVTLMEAFKSTLMPGFFKYKEILWKAGQIRSVFADFGKYSSRYDAHKRGEDVNTFKSEFSNGALMDLGVYCLYPIIKLFGEPKDVKAFSAIVPGGVDGAGVTILDYEDFTAILKYSKVGNSYLPTEIQGEDATIIIDRINQPRTVEIIYRNGEKELFNCELMDDDMYYEAREFIDCILNEKTESDINDHETSLTVMKVMDNARLQSGVLYPADKKILGEK